MAYSGNTLPQIQPAGVSAYFVDTPAANKASRALQEQMDVPTEAISRTRAPGVDPGKVTGQGAYLGISGGGRVLLNVAVPDAGVAERAIELLARLGGEVANAHHGSPSTGGYGPTTGWGRYGVIGGEPETSAMAPQCDGTGQDERNTDERGCAPTL